MRFKATTWILAAALVAVVAYFFLVEERNRTTAERTRQESSKLFLYEPKDIEKFALINPQGERIEATQDSSGWKVVFPVETPGDNPTITSFIGQAVPGRRGETVRDPGDAARYGLAKPFATLIIFRRDTPPPDTLFVGDKTPTSSNTYVRLGGSSDILISSVLTHNVMNKNLFHFRDKNFLSLPSDSIGALTIRTPKETLDLRREGRYWWFASRRVRADRMKIEPFLTKLTSAIIYGFVREDLSELASYGLDNPSRELILSGGGGATRIVFGSRIEDKVHAVRTRLDKVVLLDGSLLETFEWTSANLRARNLAFFNEDSVKTVRYETPDTTVVLRKSRGKWSTTGADTSSIRSWEVSALLRKLGGTSFERIVTEPLPPDALRRSPFILRVTLEDWRELVIDRITISAAGRETAGASLSANAAGALPEGAFDDIHAVFRRIGAK